MQYNLIQNNTIQSLVQNIVIGGAAGAFPPMVGWVAASGSISYEAIGMFMLIFMWTPPHFWALALFMNEDYSKDLVYINSFPIASF